MFLSQLSDCGPSTVLTLQPDEPCHKTDLNLEKNTPPPLLSAQRASHTRTSTFLLSVFFLDSGQHHSSQPSYTTELGEGGNTKEGTNRESLKPYKLQNILETLAFV